MSKLSSWLNKRLGVPETRLLDRAQMEKKIDALKPRFFDLCADYDVPNATALALWVTIRKYVIDIVD